MCDSVRLLFFFFFQWGGHGHMLLATHTRRVLR